MHLSDCFIDLLAYVSYLLKSLETGQPQYEEVRDEIRRLLCQSDGPVSRGLVPPQEYDQARFAVCAWVDEMILGSQWRERNRWLNDQLQLVHYNTTDAGEEFFERLEKIGLQQREVREVYYLCLALGFTGRYCHPGDRYQLEQIKATHLKLLLGKPDLPSLDHGELFPEAFPTGQPTSGLSSRRGLSRLVSAACVAAPVMLFAILYLVYHFTLSSISENFLRTVAN